jgi:hypothetical protein
MLHRNGTKRSKTTKPNYWNRSHSPQPNDLKHHRSEKRSILNNLNRMICACELTQLLGHKRNSTKADRLVFFGKPERILSTFRIQGAKPLNSDDRSCCYHCSSKVCTQYQKYLTTQVRPALSMHRICTNNLIRFINNQPNAIFSVCTHHG